MDIIINHPTTIIACRIWRIGFGLLRWPWVRWGGIWARMFSFDRFFHRVFFCRVYQARFLYLTVTYLESTPTRRIYNREGKWI